ncbi:hypothetical protein MAR_010761 [Mya arenaria]|uniref:Uncharacterized protein n=1 Tax=Mya arenaria TaxID=6604 RepID=A0ABY7FSC0_MYAAR|nr:hypothetical protein MAR_010761 [Mya arenaria]
MRALPENHVWHVTLSSRPPSANQNHG